MTNPNAKMYTLFTTEKERHSDKDDLTIFYRKAKDHQDASMRYVSNDKENEGTLTVIFREDGDEDFYFKKNNEKGIGKLVQHLTDGGNYGVLENEFNNMPSMFRTITQDYQYNRDELGIDEKQPPKDLENKPKKSQHERE